MFFKTQTRFNPQTGELPTYYRLVESYHNVLDKVCQRSILSDSLEDVTPEEIWSIAEGLNARLAGERRLFECTGKTQQYIDLYWNYFIISL